MKKIKLSKWLDVNSSDYGHGCCIECHEGCPINREDGFCSDICAENWNKSNKNE